jgi:hypothetical protein
MSNALSPSPQEADLALALTAHLIIMVHYAG